MWHAFGTAGPVQAAGWALLHAFWLVPLAAGLTRQLLHLISRKGSGSRYAVALAGLATTALIAPLAALGLLCWWRVLGAALLPVSGDRMMPAPPSSRGIVTLLGDGYLLLRPLLPWLVVAWVMATAWNLLRLVVAQQRIRRMIGAGTRPSAGLTARLCVLAARLDHHGAFGCVISDRVRVPTVAWCGRAWIVVPTGVLETLTVEQGDALLLHELAHLRRRDLLTNWSQCLIEVFSALYRPIARLSSLVRQEREFCCDDLVLRAGSAPGVYARALTRLEVLRASVPLALAASDGPLLQRVQRLVGREVPVPRRQRRNASLCAAALLVVAGVAAPLGARPFTSVAFLPGAWIPVRIEARDPAGNFTVTFHRRRLVDATVDGVAIPATRLRQHGDSVRIVDLTGRATLALHLTDTGITWQARPAPATPPVPR